MVNSPWLVALMHPLNLIMLVIAVIAGLLSAWWLFPLGLLLWALMLLAVARDRSVRLNQQMQTRAPVAQRFQRYFTRIERSQVRVFNSLGAAPPATRRALQPVQSELENLIQQVYALCARMTGLENYRLIAQSQGNLKSDLEHITKAIETTPDPLVRREYEESRKSLQERLAKLEAIGLQLERVEAQLLGLANELDTVVTEVVHLQALRPDAAQPLVAGLLTKLRQQGQQLATFEREAIVV